LWGAFTWLLLLPLVAGCADKDRSLSPMEALRYRQKMVREHYHELSPEQRQQLKFHQPGRTERQIDEQVAEYRAEYTSRRERDASGWTSSRRSAAAVDLGAGDSGAPTTVGGPGTRGADDIEIDLGDDPEDDESEDGSTE